ncbi:hypothetical protein GCM10007242_21100 [Pigmentiphaga litoralis]|nr:hypothetical protein GCM10007242_21100 [Pigmentiphaga litoralis]
MGKQSLPCFSQAHTATITEEQVLTKRHFQASYLPAESGLANPQDSARLGEAAKLGYRDEVFKLPQIHVMPPYGISSQVGGDGALALNLRCVSEWP